MDKVPPITLAVIGLLSLVGCATPPDDREQSLMQDALVDACQNALPTVVQDEIGVDPEALAEVEDRDVSNLISSEMKRDFSDRNMGSVRLTDFVSVPADCRVLPRAELERLGIERQWLPEPGAQPQTGLIALSRPGFSRDGSTAVVYWYTAGSGMCFGRFRVYSQDAETWRVVGEVDHLQC